MADEKVERKGVRGTDAKVNKDISITENSKKKKQGD